jgi:hypothetical protein
LGLLFALLLICIPLAAVIYDFRRNQPETKLFSLSRDQLRS